VRTRPFSREWIAHWFPLAAPVLVLLLVTLLTNLFAGVLLRRIMTLMFINMSLVLALQTFMGNSGIASFGHVGFMLIGAYGSILFTMTAKQKSFTLPDMPTSWWIHNFNLPFLPSLIVTGLVAALIGGVIGIAMIRIGRTTLGFATFALLIVIRIVALSSDPLTRGTRTVVGISSLTTLWYAAGWAIFFVAAAYLFKESSLGLRLRAAREDERAAASIGIGILWVRWVAWVVSIFMAAVAGGLWAHYVTVFSPHAFWISTNFLIITMLIIGGQASVSGAVLGTIIVTAVAEGFRVAEYTLNIQRQSVPFLQKLFPQQVVGLTEFVLALALLLILYKRPAGIMQGREFTWPFAGPGSGRERERETKAEVTKTAV
jgi:branched-chain amino acid transport system permease protein